MDLDGLVEPSDALEPQVARKELRRALDDVNGLSLFSMSRSELADHIVAMQALQASLDAHMAEASAEAHNASVHRNDNLLTLPAYVSNNSNAEPKRVAGDRNLGLWLESFPEFADAFREGRITRAHVQAFRSADNSRTHMSLKDAQGYLIELAAEVSWRKFVEVMREWELRADPDGDEPKAQVQKRHLTGRKQSDGMVKGEFLLDPIEGDIFLNALAIEEQRLMKAEDDAADITPSQRRADAAVSLFAKGAARADGTVPAPLLHITMGEAVAADLVMRLAVEAESDNPFEVRYALLALGLDPDELPIDGSTAEGRCHLADGTPIHPRLAIRALAAGTLRLLVLSADAEELELGRSVRDFPRHFKDAAIAARRGRCAVKGCDAPLSWLQADHRLPWSRDGRSDMRNLDPLCDPHNKKKRDDLPP